METQNNPNPQYQQPQVPQYGNQMLQQQNLPNASTTLILGIISLVMCGPIGLVCGIIGLNLSKKDKALYESNPNAYTQSSRSNMSSGGTCALIGVILSSLMVVFLIFYFIFFFAVMSTAMSAGAYSGY